MFNGCGTYINAQDQTKHTRNLNYLPNNHETYNFNSYYLTCILWGPCPNYKPSNPSGRALYISFSLYFENTILTFKLVLGDGPYVSKTFDFATAITQQI